MNESERERQCMEFISRSKWELAGITFVIVSIVLLVTNLHFAMLAAIIVLSGGLISLTACVCRSLIAGEVTQPTIQNPPNTTNSRDIYVVGDQGANAGRLPYYQCSVRFNNSAGLNSDWNEIAFQPNEFHTPPDDIPSYGSLFDVGKEMDRPNTQNTNTSEEDRPPSYNEAVCNI